MNHSCQNLKRKKKQTKVTLSFSLRYLQCKWIKMQENNNLIAGPTVTFKNIGTNNTLIYCQIKCHDNNNNSSRIV